MGSRSAVSVDYQERLHDRLPALPASIAPLRHSVLGFASDSGASERQREDIALAVSEALSNAVLHAYAGRDEPGTITLDAWMDGSSLEVVVGDAGIGMRPRADSPGAGFGMGLIFRMTEQLRVDSHDDARGVGVRMTFAIG